MSFGEAIKNLGTAQKSGAGVPAYTRWINRRVARLFAAIFCHAGMSPSSVSLLSIVFTMFGLSLFISLNQHPVAAGLLGAVLLAIGYALDSADGQLARLQGSSSLRGEWLDHTLDAIRLPAVHLALATAMLLRGETVMAIVAALFSIMASAAFLSQNLGGLLRDQSRNERIEVRRFQSWLLLPVDPGVLCWTFALWPLLPLFTVVYLFLFVTNLAHVSASARRRWRELDQGDRP
ncbi:CDP-alcohol phosphatidyltransferase [Actinomycetales bacterium SN12]|nr:CDP-alcohol phosphatidyltransferase [Actinomycetales bacterium SN12]